MEYTLDRMEEELQNILYHMDQLRNTSGNPNVFQISGLIRSTEQLAEYANDLKD